MATSPLVTWAYADWRSQSTTALQLEQLKLHMQEVEGFMLESAAKGRSMRLSPELMPHLQREHDRLESRLSMSALGSRFGVSSFVRGTGP